MLRHRLGNGGQSDRLCFWAGAEVLVERDDRVAGMMRSQMRQTLIAIGKIAISCALLAVIAAKINFGVVIAQWRLLDPVTIAACLAALLAEVSIIAGLRLRFVLEVLGTRRPLGNLVQVVMSGFFFEQIAFGFLGGDTMRFVQLRRFDVSAKQALGAIVTDRVLGMLGLVTLALLGLPGLFRVVSSFGHHLIVVVSVAALVAALIAAAVCFTRIADWFRRDVNSQLTYLQSRLRADAGLRARVWSAIGLAVLTQLLNILVFAMIGRAFNLNLSLIDWLFVVPPVLLISMIPLSVGGWGLREASLMVALGDLGISADDAVIPSLIFGFSLIVVTLPGGFMWLANRGRAQLGKAPLDAASHSLDAG